MIAVRAAFHSVASFSAPSLGPGRRIHFLRSYEALLINPGAEQPLSEPGTHRSRGSALARILGGSGTTVDPKPPQRDVSNPADTSTPAAQEGTCLFVPARSL